MAQVIRTCCLVLFLVGPVVALVAVVRRRGTAMPPQARECGWRRFIPPVLLPVEWLLPPTFIGLNLGDVRIEWLPVRLAGFVVGTGGAGLLVWAAVALDRFMVHRAAVARNHTLVTTGPFRYVRHPTYTGYLALLLGSGLGTLNVCVLLLWPIALFGILAQARSEERLLEAKFDPDYRLYSGRTGFLFPRVPM